MHPLASTLAYFFSQQNCPIIDVRTAETLNKYGWEIKDSYYRDRYFDSCYELKNELGVEFRELDKGLWIDSDVDNQVKAYEKLRDFGLVL